MQRERDDWRAIFESATAGFVDVVGQIEAAAFDRHALGTWTVRDLVGHASRALLTIELYLAREASPITLDGPLAYFAAAAQVATTPGGSEAIAERGRDAGAALGPEPSASVAVIAERVLGLVDRTADDAPCTTPFGGIALVAYLPTRTLELTVHSLDLARAVGGDVPDELEEPVRASLELVAEAIATSPQAAEVLLALTGRGSLPAMRPIG